MVPISTRLEPIANQALSIMAWSEATCKPGMLARPAKSFDGMHVNDLLKSTGKRLDEYAELSLQSRAPWAAEALAN